MSVSRVYVIVYLCLWIYLNLIITEVLVFTVCVVHVYSFKVLVVSADNYLDTNVSRLRPDTLWFVHVYQCCLFSS